MRRRDANHGKREREKIELGEVEELSDEALADVAGGGLRDKVYVTPTSPTSATIPSSKI